MARYLIEGCSDGALFAEAIDAPDMLTAREMAVERLREAWGETGETLDDFGDSASVTLYSDDDFARDAASDLLAYVRRIATLSLDSDPGIISQDHDDDAQVLEWLIREARELITAAFVTDAGEA